MCSFPLLEDSVIISPLFILTDGSENWWDLRLGAWQDLCCKFSVFLGRKYHKAWS